MNIGIIGCGNIANVHMGAYRGIENANVIAVSDIDLERAKTFAAKYKIGKSFADYGDILGLKDLDLVDICTPTSTHADIVCNAAKHGLDILVEKPMARSTSECERMIDETKKHESRLCICHTQLFLPSIMRAKAMVESGCYDLTSFKTSLRASFDLLRTSGYAHNWNVSPEEKGILWEVGCHHVYLQLHFLQNVKEVYAVGSKVKYPVHDEFTVLLNTPSTRYGVMEISWISKETDVAYELSSSDGKRAAIYPDFDYIFEKLDSPPESLASAARSAFSDEKRVLRKWVRFGLNYFRNTKYVPHLTLIGKYVDSLRNNTSPPVTPEDGKKTIRLLESIEESLGQRRAVMNE